MASVTSLDKDLRNLRLSRYTPQAANEVRDWIEETLRDRLPNGDLLDALKDGVALCRLVNLAVSPGVKFKQSSMPFVQMENISHFLRACQMPPLGLPPHDVFLTVDLYERKDPAQVLQCLGAFSRRANAIQPTKFPRAIGPKGKGSVVSPQLTGSSQGGYGAPYMSTRSRGISNVSDSNSASFKPSTPRSGRASPTKGLSSPKSPTSGGVSSWSKKSDEGTTAPAWNIHQYGYLGGASQGNQGISFGARRQITTPGPAIPSIAEKERRRREAEAEEQRLRQQAEEEEQRRRVEREADEKRARIEEERRWQEETARLREKEMREVEAEKRRWEEQQRRWEEDDQRRQREEKELEEKLVRERQRKRGSSDARLNGQFLSQYQATRGKSPAREEVAVSDGNQRIRELERELELAKVRERQYELERQELARSREGLKIESKKERSRSRSRPRPVPAKPVKPSYDFASQEEERKLLRTEWKTQQKEAPVPEANSPPPPSRPLPDPTKMQSRPVPPTPTSPRPLPNPANYMNAGRESRTDRFLASNPAPVESQPASHRPADYSSTAEVDAENSRRVASTQKTKAGGWASKSLLEREMERERERQQEWERAQKETEQAAKMGVKDSGSAPGQGAWDVHQYGYLGGDSQNRGGPGLGVGGARRQIIGPRPLP